MKNRFLAAAAFALALPLSAQAPVLVKDINPGSWPVGLSSDPGGFMLDGSTVYFRATGEAGTALYKFDGATTQLVKDINPGAATGSLGRLVRGGSKLLFGATSPDGRELWQTDGTAAGTTLLKDINPTGESQASMLFALGSRALLVANDGVHGSELWISDGTAAGTQLLADTVEGPSSPGFWNTNAQVGGLAFLSASTGLWVTDGTTAGTIRLASGPAVILGTIGSTVVFRGFDAERGMELWKTDGTVAGTTFVKDVAPGVTSSYPTTAFAAGTSSGSAILFFANDGAGADLWITDGSAAGTRKLFPFAPQSASWSRMPEVTYAAGLWWFTTDDGGWRSDGTAAGTFQFTDTWPTRVEGAFGKAYFLTGADELFSTDGTIAGTTLVKRFDRQFDQPTPRVLTILGGKAYFGADDGVTGFEPWVCEDGTAAGTRQMGNVMPDSEGEAHSSSPSRFRPAGDGIVFTATDTDPPQHQIWKSDGTSNGTSKIATSEHEVSALAMWNGSVVYSNGGQLFALNGSDPVFLATLPPIPINATLTSQRGLLLKFGTQLWYTDATPAGTGRLTDDAGATLELKSNVTSAAGRWYFVATKTGTSESALYTTEATPATTRIAVPGFTLNPNIDAIYSAFGALYYNCSGVCRLDPETGRNTLLKLSVSPRSWVVAGRYLYFQSSGELWRTDGTAAGTWPLGFTGSVQHVPSGDLLFFAMSSESGIELWRTNGFFDGTFMVEDINPGTAGSNPMNLMPADGMVLFSANHPSYGVELWRSDGTAEGTDLIADLEPGTTGSSPSVLVRSGRQMFFAATTLATGRELWALPLPGTSIAVVGVRVTEGNSGTKAARFTITRSGNASGTSSVAFATAPVTATEGVDYIATSGTVTFTAGQTTRDVDVLVKGDTNVEGENEAFLLLLSSPTGTALTNTTATAVIAEDDFLTGPVLDARGGATAVTLTWTAYAGGPAPVVYEVYRAYGNTTFTLIGTSSTTQFTDPATSPSYSYFYRVIARDGNGAFSAWSNTDIASRRVFTDDPLLAKATRIKALHISELHSAINFARISAGMAQYAFTPAPAIGALVRATHITELRAALSGLLAAFSMPAPAYTDLSLTAGKAIKAAHIQELRNVLK